MKTFVMMTVVASTALALVASAALGEPTAKNVPTAKKMTEQQLDTVVAGWVNAGGQPCGASQWDCGDNGWGDGYDLNNPGSYSGGTAPSKTANGTVYGYGQININPTTSNGR